MGLSKERGRWRKWIRIGMGTGLLGLFLAGVFHPWLLAWGGRWVLHRMGLEVEQWRTEGFGWYHLRGVRWEEGGTELRVEEMALRQPLSWAWVRVRGTGQSVLQVRSWEVKVEDAAPSSGSGVPGSGGAGRWLGGVPGWQDALAHWVPLAWAENGVVSMPRGTLAVDRLEWSAGQVLVRASGDEMGWGLLFRGRLDGPWRVELHRDSAPGEPWAGVDFHPAREPQVPSGSFSLRWEGWIGPGRTEGSLRFGEAGWVPQRGEGWIRAENLDGWVPGAQGLTWEGGQAHAIWEAGRWAVESDLRGTWVGAFEPVPLRIEVSGEGSLEGGEIRRLHLTGPKLEARLSEGARLAWSGGRVLEMGQVVFMLEGGKWIGLEGVLRGVVDPEVGPSGSWSGGRFSLEADSLVVKEWEASRVRVQGLWLGNKLHLEEASGTLGSGSRVRLSGGIDLADGVEGAVLGAISVEAEVKAEDFGGWPGASVSLRGWVEGPWNHPRHGGQAEVAIPSPLLSNGMEPLGSVEGCLAWEGVGWGQGRIWTEGLSWGELGLDAAASLRLSGPEVEATLERAALQDAKGEKLVLERPAVVRFRQEGGAELWVDPVVLRGPEGLAVRGRFSGSGWAMGSMGLEISGLELGWMGSLSGRSWPEARVESLQLELDWRDGEPVLGTVSVNGLWSGDPLPEDEWVDWGGALDLQAEGLWIRDLRGADWAGQFLAGGGRVPLLLQVENGRVRPRVVRGGVASVGAFLSGSPALSGVLARVAALKVENPEVELRLDGPLDSPRGSLEVRLSRLRGDGPLVRYGTEVEELSLRAELETGGVRVEEARFRLGGAEVEGHLSLPLTREDWVRAWEDGRWPDWRKGKGSLATGVVPLAALASVWPDFLAPEGAARARLGWDPLGGFWGELMLEGARLRPLPNGTQVSGLEGLVRMHGMKVVAEEVRLRVDQHPLILRGECDLRVPGRPRVNLAMRGENVALVRQYGMIVRGDLDLSVAGELGGEGRVWGRIGLRDSLVYQDFRELVRPSAASVSDHPPYFAVDSPWVGRWRLGVSIEGDRFLRVQSPLFRGRVSVDVGLGGTLASPVAVGDLWVDSGVIVFPQASLTVERAKLALTRDNPAAPKVEVVAQGMTRGQEVRMEVTGTAVDPVVEFQASPPLAQDAILLLLTTGVLASGGAASAGEVSQGLALFVGRGVLGDLFDSGEESWTRNLSIESGERISRSGRETLRIEYNLSDSWSVYGEHDAYDEFNAGLKWRFLRR